MVRALHTGLQFYNDNQHKTFFVHSQQRKEFELRIWAYNTQLKKEALTITIEINPKPKLILNPHPPSSQLAYPFSNSNTKPIHSKKIQYPINMKL